MQSSHVEISMFVHLTTTQRLSSTFNLIKTTVLQEALPLTVRTSLWIIKSRNALRIVSKPEPALTSSAINEDASK